MLPSNKLVPWLFESVDSKMAGAEYGDNHDTHRPKRHLVLWNYQIENCIDEYGDGRVCVITMIAQISIMIWNVLIQIDQQQRENKNNYPESQSSW